MPDQLNWIAAAGCAVCLTVGMLVPADADVFNWTYNGQFGQVSDNGSGTFTTGRAAPKPDPHEFDYTSDATRSFETNAEEEDTLCQTVAGSNKSSMTDGQ